jgi:hypothetical protein
MPVTKIPGWIHRSTVALSRMRDLPFQWAWPVWEEAPWPCSRARALGLFLPIQPDSRPGHWGYRAPSRSSGDVASDSAWPNPRLGNKLNIASLAESDGNGRLGPLRGFRDIAPIRCHGIKAMTMQMNGVKILTYMTKAKADALALHFVSWKARAGSMKVQCSMPSNARNTKKLGIHRIVLIIKRGFNIQRPSDKAFDTSVRCPNLLFKNLLLRIARIRL